MPVDLAKLDKVIYKTITTVDQSKNQIFDIAEQAREECEHLGRELAQVKQEVAQLITKNDKMDRELKLSRMRLTEVSKEFDRFSEDDIRHAYEQTHRIQIEYFVSQEKEKQLRQRRDELEFRLKKLEKSTSKAENVLTQINVVLGYLKGDIQQAGKMIEDVQHQQQMGFQVIQAQEEERKRVAREIHDGPAQSMANAVLRTELVEKVFLHKGTDEARSELHELREMIRESLADVRRIIFDLRPMALDDLGLVPTLKKYITEVEKKYSLRTECNIYGQESRLPSSMEVALFRLVQESLTNIIKHAQVERAHMRLEFRKDLVYLIIQDDGVGFHLKEKGRRGFGITGMEERVKLLGGKIVVHSEPGKGTKLLLTIPIKPGLERGGAHYGGTS